MDRIVLSKDALKTSSLLFCSSKERLNFEFTTPTLELR